MAKTYRVNEVFLSLQGEGIRVGTSNIFVRFSGCNMECDLEPGPKSPGGFACDTEFVSGRTTTLEELEEWVHVQVETAGGVDPKWLILTGGEPGLQVDYEFIHFWHNQGYRLAIETNGTIELPYAQGMPRLDWITLSPKVAEHAIKQLFANELKYVRGYGQGIPKPAAQAEHLLISPAFDAMEIHPKTLEWCVKLCLQNPPWRLSLQQHKFMKVR